MENFICLEQDELLLIGGGNIEHAWNAVFTAAAFVGAGVTIAGAIISAPVTAPVAVMAVAAYAVLGCAGGAAYSACVAVNSLYN